MPSSITSRSSTVSSSSLTIVESIPDSPRSVIEQCYRELEQLTPFVLSTQYSGDYHVEWHPRQSDTQGLDSSWTDPTPEPSLQVEELCEEFMNSLWDEVIFSKSEKLFRKELLKRSEDYDRRSLQLALDVYIKQMSGQVPELEVVDVLERNLIDEYGVGFIHFNFLVQPVGSDSSTSSVQLFFAETHPRCENEDDIYLCCPIEEDENGRCFGCQDRPKLLRHPSTEKYRGGHRNVGFQFMEEDYSEETPSGSSSGYSRDAIKPKMIVEWLDYAPTILSDFETACSFIDECLASRIFLVGHHMTVADIATWSNFSAVGQRMDCLWKMKKHKNLVRWFDMMDADYGHTLNQDAAACIRKPGIENPLLLDFEEMSQDSNYPLTIDYDLPGAKVGAVCLCFAPEPTGYLDIADAKTALLNRYFAERYQGRLIVLFDDTNPSKESSEFIEKLLKDMETLGVKYDVFKYTSDYFLKLMEMAESLIKQGKAYVDDTLKEQMRSGRMDGLESKSRNSTVEDNLSLWKEMINGTERGMQCCVRGKLDMQDPNKLLRDPVYYHCNTDPHHRVGSKYKVYPTYDFACPFVDALEGVTHALRSSEYHDRNAQYYRILQDLGMRRVEIYEFSQLNMVYTLLSKRKLLWFVQNKKVEDWTDPRFPTVQGIVRRGLKVEALIQFILQQGASKNLNLMEWDKLWTINKKIIDPVCARHTAVVKDQRVIFTLTNGPEKSFVRILPRHKKYEGAGKKATTFTNRIWLEYADAMAISKGEEVTLMDWGNAIIKEIKMENGVITELIGELHLEGSVKTTKLKITWLADIDELVPLSLVDFGYLISKKKLEEDEDFLDNLNPVTRKETLALGDSNMRNIKRGEVIQLERKGYYRCDAPFVRPSKPVVLFSIPDGRQQSPA